MNGSQMMTSLDCSNNNGSPFGKSKIPQLKPVRTSDSSVPNSKETVASPKGIMSPRDIMSLSRTSSREDVAWTSASTHAERWKTKYQEADRKCKSLLVKNEKTLREQNDLERRYQLLQERNELMENQLIEKETKLSKLRAVSEKVYKEYDQLKNQYDVETQAMHKAMQSAGQWYQQNRKLKRRSAALLQRLPPQAMQDWDSLDATDAASESSGGEELEGLRETVADLSKEVARLQTEISSLKLQEFEAIEQNVNLMQELEQERGNNAALEERLKEAVEEVDRSKRLARHLATEVSTYRDQLEQYKNQANLMKCEAESARKERDVLQHRSSLYLETLPENGEYSNDKEARENEEMLLKELENLRAQLEEERIQHARDIDELQEKLMDKENSDEMFLLEEKLNLAEEDVRKAIERAERAEKSLESHSNKRKSMMNRISMFEPVQKESSADSNESSPINEEKPPQEFVIPPPPPMSIPPPPPPPVPPPPPLPVMNGADGKSTTSAIADMAAILGLKQSTNTKKRPSGGAIDDIINQIKGGRFQLKSTEPKPVEKKPKDEPAALKELRNILGTLKRRPKSFKESNKENSEEKCAN